MVFKPNHENCDEENLTESASNTPTSLPVETPGMRLKNMITKRMTRVMQSSSDAKPNGESTAIQQAQLF